jgi:hypothetical protein
MIYWDGHPLLGVLQREWGKKSFLAITASTRFDFNHEWTNGDRLSFAILFQVGGWPRSGNW